MIRILVKEFNAFLDSLIAYIVIGAFLTSMGLLMWVFPETSVLHYGFADMDTLFSLAPYVFMFLIPAITMRSFAEEKRVGTLELLFTRPVTDWEIVLGKFFAGFMLVLFALLPTGIYYLSVYWLGDPPGNLDSSGVAGSYIGLALLGAVFCAVGILASSFSTNQIVSFIIAAFLCFILFSGFDSLAALNLWSSNVLLIKQLGILYHYESLGRGVIDTRDVLYFASLTAILLLATKTIISARTW